MTGAKPSKWRARLSPTPSCSISACRAMDGYAVCRAFRADAEFKNTPIVAQSGWGRQEDHVKSADAGFDHHLVKPVSFEQLEALLTEYAKVREPNDVSRP